MVIVRQQAIETILSEQFNREQLRGILGKKLYTYELRINGTRISRSNVQFNCTDSFVEITVTEFMMPNPFSPKLIEDFSLMNPSSVSIQGTSSTCTSEVRRLPDRTVIGYSFPKIEVGEIITLLVNSPDLTAALDLERNVIEITHKSLKES